MCNRNVLSNFKYGNYLSIVNLLTRLDNFFSKRRSQVKWDLFKQRICNAIIFLMYPCQKWLFVVIKCKQNSIKLNVFFSWKDPSTHFLKNGIHLRSIETQLAQLTLKRQILRIEIIWGKIVSRNIRSNMQVCFRIIMHKHFSATFIKINVWTCIPVVGTLLLSGMDALYKHLTI